MTGERVLNLYVEGEGTWQVNTTTGKITFTPIDGYVGDPTPIRYTISDIQGTEVGAVLDLEYTPIAQNDNITAYIGDTVTINILNNDKETSQDFDKDSLVITDSKGTIIGTNNSGKELVVEGEGIWLVHDNGTISFEPEDGFVSNPTPIWYKIKDTRGDYTNIATINIIYIEPMQNTQCTSQIQCATNTECTPTSEPIENKLTIEAVDDSIRIVKYRTHDIQVLENDRYNTDASIQITKAAKYGETEIITGENGKEIVLYTPFANIEPTIDTFDYLIVDELSNTSNEAIVTIDIQCASSQTSDNGGEFGIVSILMMMFMSLSVVFYLGRIEEKNIEMK